MANWSVGTTSSDRVSMLARVTGQSRAKMIIAVLLAIAVVLSAISAFYYVQAKDYHDAKYRAQWVLMDDLLTSSDNVVWCLWAVTGHYPPGTLEYRALWAVTLQDGLASMIGSAWALREMYLNDQAKNETFDLLGRAMKGLQDEALVLAASLWDNVTQGIQYSENETLNDKLLDIADTVSGLHDAFNETFKVDPNQDAGRSWEHSPYSLVDRLDLQYVREASQGILDSL